MWSVEEPFLPGTSDFFLTYHDQLRYTFLLGWIVSPVIVRLCIKTFCQRSKLQPHAALRVWGEQRGSTYDLREVCSSASTYTTNSLAATEPQPRHGRHHLYRCPYHRLEPSRTVDQSRYARESTEQA